MENLPQICVDTSDAFITTERFGTREEVIRWIKEVGIDNKVTVIISRSDTETRKRGRSNKLIFGCDKGGKHKSTDSGTQSASKKCGCPFKVRSTPAKDGSGWKIDVKYGLHNHGLPDRLEGHSFIGRLTTDEKQHVADLTKRHVPPRHILLSLQDRDPENVTRITQVYKHKSVIQKEIRGPRSEILHLFKLIEDASYVYWSRKIDDSEVVRDIFWAHPDSVKLLNIFLIVLVMDNTYKTKKYRQPLFEIVGMTSTELTFAVAFAYMESEQKENFCWVLEKLKELFVKKDLCPQVILTDRDLALMKEIEIVFPRSINFLCRFHINKNVGAKCKQHMVNDMQKTIDTLWMKVVWASDEVEYGQQLHQLEQACVDYSGFMNYVKDTWLTPHRHRFVGAWINRVLHLGNTTTNRASFQKSFYEVEHAHISPFYGYLRGSVSRAALRRIAEELLRVDYVGTNRQICGCTLRTSYGLPCACELGRYALGGIPIPIDVVHVHWRKLTMEVELEVGVDDGSEVDMTCVMDEFWKRFRSYIEDVVNVESDGNCGFRVIASLHGYGEDGWPMVRRELGLEIIDKDSSTLYDKLFSNRLLEVRESLMIESFGSQPLEKWLTLPDMCYLIANRYNVVLVCLGNPCMTFFPMTSSHSPNVSIYCIGFVNQNHWVQVNMKEGFPLPPITLAWKKFRSHTATSWMLGFAGRLQHWQLLTPILA
ncbi:hypothetical protein KIW84_032738 [Lathyrus oleraceus]|uniref:MULE transposase domain-containing protein n=1 Tax=Pisum sativum TaxID=3888 RepID=A0A9D5B242_PEA|nr:hypothetical protein KIW84_032738 [Pisum sativum]